MQDICSSTKMVIDIQQVASSLKQQVFSIFGFPKEKILTHEYESLENVKFTDDLEEVIFQMTKDLHQKVYVLNQSLNTIRRLFIITMVICFLMLIVVLIQSIMHLMSKKDQESFKDLEHKGTNTERTKYIHNLSPGTSRKKHDPFKMLHLS